MLASVDAFANPSVGAGIEESQLVGEFRGRIAANRGTLRLRKLGAKFVGRFSSDRLFHGVPVVQLDFSAGRWDPERNLIRMIGHRSCDDDAHGCVFRSICGEYSSTDSLPAILNSSAPPRRTKPSAKAARTGRAVQ